MSWLTTFLEKTNINILILSLSIVSVGLWLYTKNLLFLSLSSIGIVYLAISLVVEIFKYLRNSYYSKLRRAKVEEWEKKKVAEENMFIEIWYKTKPDYFKKSLLDLMRLGSLNIDTPNIKIETNTKRVMINNNINFLSISTNDPMHPIYPIKLINSDSMDTGNRAFYIHPHLYKILKQQLEYFK